MHEIEIKFQVDPSRRARVAAEVAGPNPPRRLHLQAAYFDTADRALAKARIALRVRREGRRWVQTLKGAADDGLTRFEHNVDLAVTGAQTPAADPSLHAGTDVGDRLAKLIAASTGDGLTCLYRTDVWRRARRVRTRLGTVELAFDEGRIVAGDASLPIRELEIELVAGSPLAVIETARRWMVRHGLHHDTRSKSERGDMLARGVRLAPARHAAVVALDPSMTIAEAGRAVMRSCLDQVAVNASQVASGEFEDAHLHQLRVGLRRLRTALRFFEVDPVSSLATGADTLFHALGAARDGCALAASEAAIGAAMRAAGVALSPPRLAEAAMADPTAILRDRSAQALLLDLFAAAQESDDPPPSVVDPDATLRRFATGRIRRLHKQVLAEASRFDELDDAGRHHLRRRAKRLRYAVEFSAALFGRKPVARFLKTLRGLQQRLGDVADAAVALTHARDAAPHDPASAFAAGWLAARRDLLVERSRPSLVRFAKVEPFRKTR